MNHETDSALLKSIENLRTQKDPRELYLEEGMTQEAIRDNLKIELCPYHRWIEVSSKVMFDPDFVLVSPDGEKFERRYFEAPFSFKLLLKDILSICEAFDVDESPEPIVEQKVNEAIATAIVDVAFMDAGIEGFDRKSGLIKKTGFWSLTSWGWQIHSQGQRMNLVAFQEMLTGKAGALLGGGLGRSVARAVCRRVDQMVSSNPASVIDERGEYLSALKVSSNEERNFFMFNGAFLKKVNKDYSVEVPRKLDMNSAYFRAFDEENRLSVLSAYHDDFSWDRMNVERIPDARVYSQVFIDDLGTWKKSSGEESKSELDLQIHTHRSKLLFPIELNMTLNCAYEKRDLGRVVQPRHYDFYGTFEVDPAFEITAFFYKRESRLNYRHIESFFKGLIDNAYYGTVDQPGISPLVAQYGEVEIFGSLVCCAEDFFTKVTPRLLAELKERRVMVCLISEIHDQCELLRSSFPLPFIKDDKNWMSLPLEKKNEMIFTEIKEQLSLLGVEQGRYIYSLNNDVLSRIDGTRFSIEKLLKPFTLAGKTKN